jgi:hypothetical protein
MKHHVRVIFPVHIFVYFIHLHPLQVHFCLSLLYLIIGNKLNYNSFSYHLKSATVNYQLTVDQLRPVKERKRIQSTKQGEIIIIIMISVA